MRYLTLATVPPFFVIEATTLFSPSFLSSGFSPYDTGGLTSEQTHNSKTEYGQPVWKRLGDTDYVQPPCLMLKSLIHPKLHLGHPSDSFVSERHDQQSNRSQN